jgi:hypothetical protein
VDDHTKTKLLRDWAAKMLPIAKKNRDDLHNGYEKVLSLYVKADSIRENYDIVDICKAMLHWVFIFRDINNIELAIFKSIDDEVLVRTLQKTHCLMIFAFLEKWSGLLKSKELAAVRKRFPALADMNSETENAFEVFESKWGAELKHIRNVSAGHYEDALDMQGVWRNLTFDKYLTLVGDFRLVEKPFVVYVGETIAKVQKAIERRK